MNRNERANISAEYGFSQPQRLDGKPAYADFGTALSVGSSLLGGMMQGDAAEDAQQAQSQSSAAAIDEQRRQFDQGRKDLAPWRDTGGAALNSLASLLGLRTGTRVPVGGMTVDQFDDAYDQPVGRDWNASERSNIDRAYEQYLSGLPQEYGPDPEGFGDLNKKFTLADFWDDPVTKASFQFGLDEGTKALDRMSGARGMRNSGQAVKELTRFGTNYTGQKAGESYNRFYGDQDRTYNRLAGVAGAGQTAATNTASMGANTANNISSLISGQGNARGASAIAASNAMSGGIQNSANTFSNWLSGRNPYATPSYNPYSMSNTHW